MVSSRARGASRYYNKKSSISAKILAENITEDFPDSIFLIELSRCQQFWSPGQVLPPQAHLNTPLS